MIIVFNKTNLSVPAQFETFNDIDDLKFLIRDEGLENTDVISLPHGEDGTTIVKFIANRFMNGKSCRIMPVINIHSGTPAQKQELADMVESYRKLFDDKSMATHFNSLQDLEYENTMIDLHDN